MKILKFMLVWIAYYLLVIPTKLLGLIVVAVLSRYRDVNYVDLPGWSRPWANPEDWKGQVYHDEGCLPWWWVETRGVGFWSFYRYHALRNGANGLRSFPMLSIDMIEDRYSIGYSTPAYLMTYEPWELRERGRKSARYWAWVGWKAGFKYTRILSDTRYMLFMFGWRIQPSFKVAGWIHKPDALAKYTGLTIKIELYRKY